MCPDCTHSPLITSAIAGSFEGLVFWFFTHFLSGFIINKKMCVTWPFSSLKSSPAFHSQHKLLVFHNSPFFSSGKV